MSTGGAVPLRLADVVRVFGRPPNEVRALDGVSLVMSQGEVLVILGRITRT